MTLKPDLFLGNSRFSLLGDGTHELAIAVTGRDPEAPPVAPVIARYDVDGDGNAVAEVMTVQGDGSLRLALRPHAIYEVSGIPSGRVGLQRHIVWIRAAGSYPAYVAGRTPTVADAIREYLPALADKIVAAERARVEAERQVVIERAAALRRAHEAERAERQARVEAERKEREAAAERFRVALPRHMAAAHPAVRLAAVTLADSGERTKTAALAAVRKVPAAARKGITLQDAAAQALQFAPRSAEARSRAKRFGYAAPVQKPLAERMRELTRAGVVRAAKRVVRHGGPAGTTWQVVTAGPGAEAGYELTTRAVYGVYRGRHSGDRATADTHRITVLLTWAMRVRGIADGSGVVAGALILDVMPVVETGDRERRILRARVVRPGRGYSINVGIAYLSCWPYGVVTVHASPSAALAEHVPAEVHRREAKAKADERLRIEREDAARRALAEDEAALAALAL